MTTEFGSVFILVENTVEIQFFHSGLFQIPGARPILRLPALLKVPTKA